MSNRKLSMPDFSLKGKTAVVTGGSKGIGYGIAASLANCGANVLIVARTEADLKTAAEEINSTYAKDSRCAYLAADSGKMEDIDGIVSTAVTEFGALDILVNNAGIAGKTAMILDDAFDLDNYNRVVSTNLQGVLFLARAAAAQMIRQESGGKIINVASMFAFIGEKGMAVYSATKSAVASLTKTMAAEWAKHNILVNAVCPGYVLTPMNETYLADQKNYDRIAKKTVVRRVGTIEEIAHPVAALAGNGFSYMTGTTLLLDGGQTIGA